MSGRMSGSSCLPAPGFGSTNIANGIFWKQEQSRVTALHIDPCSRACPGSIAMKGIPIVCP